MVIYFSRYAEKLFYYIFLSLSASVSRGKKFRFLGAMDIEGCFTCIKDISLVIDEKTFLFCVERGEGRRRRDTSRAGSHFLLKAEEKAKLDR
jgi:hypothetical protein